MIDATDIGSQLVNFAPLVVNNPPAMRVEQVWFLYIERTAECTRPGTSSHHLTVILDLKSKNKVMRDLKKEPCVKSVRSFKHVMPYGTWLAFSPYATN